MKKLISIAAVLMVLFVGCSNQENSITNPVTDDYVKTTSNNTSTFGKSLVPTISVTQLINGAVGGYVKLSDEYVDAAGRIMKVDAALFFPQGSFEGTQAITMTADFTNASVLFSPHMQFNKSVSLCVQFQGLPLGEMGYSSNCKVNFVYFGDDGNIYPIGSKGVSMNYNRGSLKVTNAWLYHFSRYGFVRKEE